MSRQYIKVFASSLLMSTDEIRFDFVFRVKLRTTNFRQNGNRDTQCCWSVETLTCLRNSGMSIVNETLFNLYEVLECGCIMVKPIVCYAFMHNTFLIGKSRTQYAPHPIGSFTQTAENEWNWNELQEQKVVEIFPRTRKTTAVSLQLIDFFSSGIFFPKRKNHWNRDTN